MRRPAPSPDQVSWLTDPPTPRPSRHLASGFAGFVPVHSCGAAPACTGFPSIRAVHGSVAVYLMGLALLGSLRRMGADERRGALRSCPGPPAKTGLVMRARQVSWLSDRPTPRAFPARAGQWLSRVSSPNTVTGSRRIRTAFPLAPVGNTSAKRRHLIKPGTTAQCSRRSEAPSRSGRRRYGRRSATAMRSPLNASGATVAGGASRVTERYRQPKAADASGSGSRYTSTTQSTRFTIQ